MNLFFIRFYFFIRPRAILLCPTNDDYKIVYDSYNLASRKTNISEEDAKFFIELHSFKRKSKISISITSSQTTLVIRRQSN